MNEATAQILSSGIETFSVPDLLSLIIGRKRATTFANLMGLNKGLIEILQSSPEELMAAGLTEQETLRMKLVMWASDKAITDEAKRGPLSIANSSKAVYKIMQRRFLGKKTERMIGLFVDVQMQILSDRLLFTGTVSSSYVYIRDILKIGLDLHASGVILVHNHPAGNPTPSSMDKDVTDKVTRALRMVEMDLLDHVIIGQGSFYSMKENGDLLPYPNILAVTGGTS